MDKKMINIGIIALCFFSFFGYASHNDFVLLIFGLIPLIVVAIMKKDLKIYYKTIIWLICYIIVIFSYTYSINKTSTLYYIVYFGVLLLCKLILDKNNDWPKFFLKVVMIFCSIHLFFSCVSLINTDIVRNINVNFMNSVQLQNFDNWTKLGAKIGIHSDPSMMAFIASVSLGIAFSKILSNEKSNIWKIAFAISALSLLITTKRGILLAVIVAIATLILSQDNMNKKIVNILKITVVMIIGYLIIQQLSIFNSIFERFNNLDSNNYLSGREDLYQKEISKIKENVFIGNGAFTTNKFLDGYDGHNIYIQILLEYGLFGEIGFVILFLYNIYITLKALRNLNSEDGKVDVYFSFYIQVLFLVYGISGNPLYNFYIFSIYIISSSIPITELKRINKIN